jgi:putative SOS response-associated peptidase YedK
MGLANAPRCLIPARGYYEWEAAVRSLAGNTHPLLAEILNTLFTMFSGLPHEKPQYMKRRSEFPTPQGRKFGA